MAMDVSIMQGDNVVERHRADLLAWDDDGEHAVLLRTEAGSDHDENEYSFDLVRKADLPKSVRADFVKETSRKGHGQRDRSNDVKLTNDDFLHIVPKPSSTLDHKRSYYLIMRQGPLENRIVDGDLKDLLMYGLSYWKVGGGDDHKGQFSYGIELKSQPLMRFEVPALSGIHPLIGGAGRALPGRRLLRHWTIFSNCLNSRRYVGDKIIKLRSEEWIGCHTAADGSYCHGGAGGDVQGTSLPGYVYCGWWLTSDRNWLILHM